MISTPDSENLRPSSFGGFAILTGGFAILLLGALLPLPRAVAISSQPWKVELLAGLFLLSVGVWAFRNTKKVSPGVAAPLLIVLPVFLLTMWSAVSALWAQFPGLTLHHTFVWAACLLFFLLLLSLLRSANGLAIITTTFVITALVIAVVCAIEYLTLIDFTSVEGAIRQRYAKFAEMLVTILPVLWVLLLYIRPRRRYWSIFLIANLAWIAVMLSLSRGAFLAGIGAFVIMFVGIAVFATRRTRKRVLALAAVWLGATLAVQLFFTLLSPAPSTTDYLTGNAGETAVSSQIRVVTWRIAATMATQHPILGVGADNFGVAVNTSRASLPQTVPPQREMAEDLALERAHNEPLQMLAELGIVGFVLFTMPFAVFAVGLVRRVWRDRRLSPVLSAATAGMLGFFASSMVSSFSFRAMQNAIAFTMVFALGVYQMTKPRGADRKKGLSPRALSAACVLLAVVMIAWFGVKGVSEVYVARAEATSEFDRAEMLYKTALTLDPQNANARFTLGMRHAQRDEHAKAAAYIREAIDRGLGVTLSYSLLAKHHALSGDLVAAEKTFAEAVRIFPDSVYLRVVNANFLESINKTAEADEQMRIARLIDPRQANGWNALIRRGSTAAFYESQKDDSMTAPPYLLPYGPIRQYLDKTP